MLHHRDDARFPPDVMLGIQAKEFNLGFYQTRDSCFSWSESLKVHFGKVQAGCHLPCVWSLYHKGLIGGGLQRWLSSVTKSRLPRLLCLAVRPALGRVLVVLNVYYLRMMDATVFFGTFNAAEMFWYPSPDLCINTLLSWSSKDNSFDLMAWFLFWHALSTVGPYIDSCVPFQIMSDQLN